MKKLIIASTILILISCNEKNTGAFTVSGTIENAQGRKILLMELPYLSSQSMVLDSATVDAKGSFNLKGLANEENLYRLVLDKGPEVILINDGKNIEVKMDIKDYRNYHVSGSPASENLHQLFEDYANKDSAVLSTFKELDTLQKQQGNDSLLVIVKARKAAQLKDLNKTVTDFIASSSSPAAVFYAIGLATRTMPATEVKPLIDQALVKFKNHSGLMGMQKIIADQTKVKAPAGNKLMDMPAPDISMNDVKGNTISLSSFKGKFVLVDFWASWCGPCRAENPNVVKAFNKFKDRNFTILGVSLDEDKAAWQQAIAKDKLVWTQISDLKQWESAAVAAYGIEGIPFNVLVNPEGKIIATGLRGEELERKLEEVLK